MLLVSWNARQMLRRYVDYPGEECLAAGSLDAGRLAVRWRASSYSFTTFSPGRVRMASGTKCPCPALMLRPMSSGSSTN